MNKSIIMLISLMLVFCSVIIPVYGDVNLTNGLESYWKLDNFTDETGNHDGTNHGATTSTSCKLGGCYSFDGGDWIDVGTMSFGNSTIMTWANITSGSGSATIFGATKSGGINYYRLTWVSGSVTVEYRNPDAGNYKAIGLVTPLSEGNMHHIVAYLHEQNLTVHIYVNGTQKATANKWGGGTPYGTTTETTSIGRGGTSAYYVTGIIDDTAVWNRILNQTEITALWNSGDGLSYPFTEPEPPAPVPEGNLTFRFFNGDMTETDQFGISEEVYPTLNWSYVDNDTEITSGICNITAYNASIEQHGTPENVTVCGSGCTGNNLEYNFTDITASMSGVRAVSYTHLTLPTILLV